MRDEIADTVASRIAMARSLAGMSQNELALATGIAAPQISRYEQGRNVPRSEKLAKIAKALKVSLESLSAGVCTAVGPVEGVAGNPLLVHLEDESMLEKLGVLANKSGRMTINREINFALLSHIANSENSEAAMLSMSEEILEKLAEKIARRISKD